MDQAVKSALDKYLGKSDSRKTMSTDQNGQKLINIFLVVLIISTVLMCSVKFNLFGLGDIWAEAKNTKVGDKTVGQIVEGVKEEIDGLFEITGDTNFSPQVDLTNESADSIENSEQPTE